MQKILAVVLCVLISGFIPYMSIVSANSNKEKVNLSNLSVNGTNGNYLVKGMIFGSEDVYYTVEDGHNELIAKKKVPLTDHKFMLEIHLDKKDLPTNGTVILYFSEDGKEPYPVVLETFS
ncbi:MULTISPECIES: hypothetical protein [Bacillaceae]|uniref:hypothetical protein n=1 Tax=Bacillaceae TaxID=186817 RepID=UPI001F314AD6|nr:MULTISPECIES: hypothetical protein [Bacillaceae]MCF2650000.1 hypothetical protein [Niallia circulans]CAI9386571.1 hypothetical protein BACSP_01672 [Bacillus sp. T2.9-1]